MTHSRVAGAAVHRSVVAGLEGDFRLAAALCADAGEQLSLALSAVFLGGAALFAELRLVLEALFSVEFLLTGGEHELVAALFASQCDVFVHVFFLALRK